MKIWNVDNLFPTLAFESMECLTMLFLISESVFTEKKALHVAEKVNYLCYY